MAEGERQITTQGINSLRKSGKLEEALGHARRLYAGDANDPWIVRTLFWCLHDEFKRVREANNPDSIAAVANEVESLNLPNEESDQVMHDCAARILGTDPVAKATLLSKAGKHREAVELLRPIAKAKEARQHEIEAYGWILFRKIRDCGENEHDVPAWCLNEFLNCWSSDRNPNPMLFKNIFIQAKLHAENWTGVIALIEKLGLPGLKPEDFADETLDSDFAPFQDQLLGAVHKYLKKHPLMRENQPVIRQWLEAWKDSFGDDEWPQYHLGQILLWTGGNLDHAQALLLKTVQRNPEDFWRWQALAEVLQGDEVKAALSRGIRCTCEDSSFKVPLYKEYAELLAAEGELPAAKASLEEAMRLRKLSGNEWREPIPAWFDQNSEGGVVDIHQYAIPFAAKADDLLAADLPSRLCVLIRPLPKEGRFLFLCPGDGTRTLKFRKGQSPPPEVGAIEAKFEDREGGICMVLAWDKAEIPSDLGDFENGVVDHVNPNKQLAGVATATHEFIPLYYDRWHNASRLAHGMFVELQILHQQDNKPIVLKWGSVEPKLIPDFVIPVQGRFDLHRGKSFGHIVTDGNTIFVPPEVATNLKDGGQVVGWAIRSTDKHGQPSWKLLHQNHES